MELVTLTTGVAGRATVLTAEAELLLGVTAGEAGGRTAFFPLLLAPLAPLAAPAVAEAAGSTVEVVIDGNRALIYVC